MAEEIKGNLGHCDHAGEAREPKQAYEAPMLKVMGGLESLTLNNANLGDDQSGNSTSPGGGTDR